MTAILTARMITDRLGHPPPASPPWPVHGVPPQGVRLVREEDAAAFVVDAQAVLALRGHNPVITAENSVWLMRLAVVMLDRFGIGAREMTEENDG